MAEDNPYLRSLVIVANIIGFVYNIPQVILTVRTKSANDLSGVFLILRLTSAVMWIIYTTILWSPDVFISWIITGTSSGILFYYKVRYSEKSIIDEIRFCDKKKNIVELKDKEEEQNSPV
jgi:uncharacterized protein with PQ loop repeat